MKTSEERIILNKQKFYHEFSETTIFMGKMFTENFFSLLLNLEEGWIVKSIETDLNKEEVYINIDCILTEIFDNSIDELAPLYDYSPMRTWRHLDTLQFKTFIKCALPRVKTSEGKVKTINPNWASGHQRHTFLFEHAVIDLLKATKNQTRTAEIMRCPFNLVNRILHLATARGMERRNHSDLKFKHLSIDEKSFRKGHNYITVLSHPMSGCVLDVEEDRTKESCKKLINQILSEEQRMEVQTISMDMSKAFMSSAEELLPKAQIVHDRFHLISYLNTAIDQVRRREVKKHVLLKESRYALLKNPANLTDKQWMKFKSIRNANYQVSKAWIVRENFKDLFSSDKHHGATLYYQWATDAMSNNIQEVTKVVSMFNSHISGVVSALINNAMAERLNGKIQELKTVARGYRTFHNFRSAILFFNGGLDLYPH